MPAPRSRLALALPLLTCCLLLIASASLAAREPVAAPHPDDVPGEIPEGHSGHGEAFNEGPRQAGQMIAGCGRISFPVSSSDPRVRPLMEQGIGQLHGYWTLEAERSFRQAAVYDPNCAILYWGMAMANSSNSTRAKEFIGKAIRLKEHASPREWRYITILNDYLNGSGSSSDRAKNFTKALKALSEDYPDDLEALAFYGHAAYKNRSRMKLKYEDVDTILKRVLKREPLHPVHHYRIHLWDYKDSKQALDSAAKCGASAPSIAHMWHMPGHIYARLKRYADSAWQQEASARVDHAHMQRVGLLPDQIHNYSHNNEWLTRNLIYLGRGHQALTMASDLASQPRHPKYNTLSKRKAAYYGRTRMLQTLEEFEMWEQALGLLEGPLLDGGTSSSEKRSKLRLRTAALLELGFFVDADILIDDFETELNEKIAKAKQAKADDKGKKKSSRDPLADDKKLLAWMQGRRFLAEGNFGQALKLLKEGKADAYLLAEAELQSGQPAEAARRVLVAVKSKTREVLPLARSVSILWRAERRDDAARLFEVLRLRASDADLDLAPLARLAPIAEALGHPQDWRIAHVSEDDLGLRPDHDSLGPLTWSPSSATGWTHPTESGTSISLSDYRGKPVVVVFYLGFGCLHCAEQIQKLIPLHEKYEAAGLSVVAVSTEDVELLTRAKGDFGQQIPFPQVCDPELRTFKAWGVHDDFENQPLHGTFLIDGDGFVRWRDVSYEPFMDLDFLLEESQRLLRIPVRRAPVAAPRPDLRTPSAPELVGTNDPQTVTSLKPDLTDPVDSPAEDEPDSK